MNTVYQRALADLQSATTRHYGVATQATSDGGEVICHIGRVAGRSVVSGHYRVTWHYRGAGERFSKQISRRVAMEQLGALSLTSGGPRR